MLKKVCYLTREQNTKLDELLMGKYSFLSETLMELAGLAVAQVTHQLAQEGGGKMKKIVVLVGPGNNGGDGLVAGRHLKMMSYDVNIYMFKRLDDQKNGNFLKLCTHNRIPHAYVDDTFMKAQQPLEAFSSELTKYDLVIDSLFGFPFKGEMREPYKTLIPALAHVQEKTLAVDIPSGWDANEGNIKGLFTPAYLVSLGMPKLAMQGFKGRHFLGGRFIPPTLAEELNI